MLLRLIKLLLRYPVSLLWLGFRILLQLCNLLKEQVLDIFDEENQTIAVKRFEVWFDNVTQSGLKQFDNVVKTIRTYFYGIANYFKHRITNGAPRI